MKKSTFKNVLIIILSLIIVVGCILFYFYGRQPAVNFIKPEKPIEVVAELPKIQDISIEKNFIGRVAAIRSVNILPYLSGYVADIPSDSGQQVKRGDILIILRQSEYKAAVHSAYAAVLSAVADLQNSKNQYQRLQKAGAKAVSQSELDNAETAVLTSEAAVKQAAANLETARINLNYTLIRAPFDGVLGNINIAVGDFVTPSMKPSLVRIVQYNPARVIFSVTDKEFLQQHNLFKDKVRLILSDGKKYPFSGKVIYTENAIEKSTNTLAVYAEFENPDKMLIPNAYVKVLLEHTYKNVVSVSGKLIQKKNNISYLYVVKNDKVVLKPVDILADNGESVILKNNFIQGESLITQEIEPHLVGQKVLIKNQSPEEK